VSARKVPAVTPNEYRMKATHWLSGRIGTARSGRLVPTEATVMRAANRSLEWLPAYRRVTGRAAGTVRGERRMPAR
jgi:hypothetical protein